jgi:opacity protein-like surface antigen
MFRSSKLFAAVLVVLVFATAAFAFAAANTMPASTYAGEGSSVTSGYTVSAVVYNLNTTTPSNIDSVTFSLNAAASNVSVRLVTTGSYFNCTNTSGFNWSCTTTGVTVAAANEFRVVASQ